MPTRIIAALLALSGLVTLAAHAAPDMTLQQAVKSAVVGNPDVQARWHAFQASLYEQDVARGGYYPRVDLSTGAGRETLAQAGLPTRTFTRPSAVLSLSQMLFDGFATRDEVARLGFAKLGRYYELIDTTEATALEATKAYLDVLRYRELARLAAENYAQHEQIYKRIQERVQAGVGRRVDFEQAAGRLALAQSNILTEASNLHDVSARYQRIVGSLPPDAMATPERLVQGIPATVREALQLAYQASPAFNAAIESVRAAQADAHGREANFLPRIDLRARKDMTDNYNGGPGRRDDQVVEVVLNYNLFKGGADQALRRQYAEQLQQARDLRDKTCRDIRQTLVIAFNDIQNLSRQLGFLDQHQLSIEKAREAYRKQFDIGQRTLLDLLDTENEYFQSRRAYVNATFEYAIAHARTLAGMGTLLTALHVRRDGLPTPGELGQDRTRVDADSQCAAEAPDGTLPDSAVPPSAAAPPAPAHPPASAPADPATAAPMMDSLSQTLSDWASAWAAKDVPRYLGFYASTFVPEGGASPEAWANTRRARLQLPGTIAVEVRALKPVADNTPAITEFMQIYRRGDYRDASVKRLEWVREDKRWKIQREQILQAPDTRAEKPERDISPARRASVALWEVDRRDGGIAK